MRQHQPNLGAAMQCIILIKEAAVVTVGVATSGAGAGVSANNAMQR